MQEKHTQNNISKWMPLWIGDMRRECMGQPPEFVGMYLNLMMAAWENGGQLPDDEKHLCRISGATAAQWREYRQALANLFVPRHGVWSHNRIRVELEKAANISLRRKAASIKGNASRWGNAKSAAMTATDTLLAKIAEDGGIY
jgi:uncharacterized protein YdaU (DUF1376 family)